MTTLSVIIPSRTQPRQAAFLDRAVKSIRAQTVWGAFPIEICVGLDLDAPIPEGLANEPNVRFVRGSAKSQVAALNAAMHESTGELVAILEDDDRWEPRYLQLMMELAAQAALVTSNELEVNEAGVALNISDCATPSAWVFHRSLWDRVGPFDSAYRYHFDCDWLGRVSESGAARIHVVESGAPLESEAIAGERPFLDEIMRQNGATIRLARHEGPHPLVVRMRHPGAGMELIATQDGPAAQSRTETQRLVKRYGVIPR